MPGLDYGPLARAGDEDALREILTQSFHFPADKWARFADRIGRDNLRLLRRRGKVVAGLGFYPMGQWFGGRSVPAWGVCAVGVAAEARGGGAAADLMTGFLREVRGRGIALSTLYPSTQTLYRKVGYEQAGVRQQYEIRAKDIAMRDRELEAYEVDVNGVERLRAPYRELAMRTNGLLDRNAALWERLADPYDGSPVRAFAVGSENALRGYLVFQQVAAERGSYDLAVRDFIACEAAVVRRLWTLLADHRSLAETVRWYGPGVEPLLLHLAEQEAKPRACLRWMLRIVDLQAALAGRGYPRRAAGRLALEVVDPLLPENTGRVALEVEGGRARVTAADHVDLTIDVSSLATLYSGMWTAAQLRAHGRLSGAEEAIAVADALFAGPEPWMAEMF